MRNKQLQEKLEEMLEAIRKQPDDMVVASYKEGGLYEVGMFGFYFANPEGNEAEEGDKVDCIILNV